MNKYRPAALAMAACAASLCAAACSSGSSTTSSSSASPATSSPAAPIQSSAAPTTGPAVPGRTIAVKGTLGTFPVPAAAKVVENLNGGKAVVIVFGLIDPADVSRFYATALPKAGYSVTSNAMESRAGSTGANIQFTGHGYKGNIASLYQFPYGLTGLGNKNVTTIIASPAK